MSGGVENGSGQRAVVTEADVAAAIDAAGLKPTAPLIEAVARHVREGLREALVMRAFAEVRAASRRRAG